MWNAYLPATSEHSVLLGISKRLLLSVSSLAVFSFIICTGAAFQSKSFSSQIQKVFVKDVIGRLLLAG